MKSKPVVTGLALAALFFAILLPPEAYPDGKLAVIICSTFAFFFSLAEKRIHPTYLYTGLLTFGLLLFHALTISIDSYRSLEFITVLWSYFCLFGFFFYAGSDPLLPVAVSMVALCAIVSGYGLYQYFWGFDRLYNFIFYASSDSLVKVPALDRIATKRVYSTLALPGTLWGFLVMAIPFHAVLWRKSPLVRLALAASAAMLFASGFLTRSFGFLLGLFVLTSGWLVLRRRRIAWNRLTAVLIVLVVAGGAFYSARRGIIEGANPLSLRMKNWISAWSIFAENPWGTGLNTFGVVYTQYILPGGNETQYTHNTLLQLLSELGYPSLLIGAVVLLLAARGIRRGDFETLSPLLLLAAIVWAVHNLIDINVYFPSLGTAGAILYGVLLRKPSIPPQPQARFATAMAVVAGIVVVAFSGLVMVSSELQQRARAEFEENKLQSASTTLSLATSLMPLNSSLFHDSGDVSLNLYHNRRQASDLDRATQSFSRAIGLSPAKAGSHTGLSLCLSSADRIDEALNEIHIAQRLYPDSTYIQSITRLLERRKEELFAKRP